FSFLMSFLFPYTSYPISTLFPYTTLFRSKLLPLILLAAAAFLVQHVFNSLRIILNNTFEQRVIFDLRSDLYSHIQLLPLNVRIRSEEHTSELQSRVDLVCRLLLEKKNITN